MGVRANALSVFSRVLSSRSVAAAFVAIPLSMLPVLAGAVETDRITVEDPATGAVKFKVTSEGNVTGASFAGDGSALVNVPHWKGSWSAVTAYNKDEVVSYGGSSYIALAQSTNAQPNLFPASWAVFAQQGANGADGAPGTPGSPGPQGIQGPKGDPGSPDTQAQILSKIAGQADGAVLTMQQGVSTDSVTSVKFAVTDTAGNRKVVATPSGIGIGVAAPDRPFVLDTSVNPLAAGNSSVIVQGDVNKERFEIRSFGSAGFFAPTFMGMGARGTKASPQAVGSGDILFYLSGFGWNGTAYGGSNPAGNSGAASISMNANETHTTTAKGSYIDFQTTANGTTARTTRLRVGNDGSIGIGTTAPAQKLEVKDGGVRINNTLTPASKPACASGIRGTFWLTQQGAGAMDTLEVCIKDAAEAYVWKAVW